MEVSITFYLRRNIILEFKEMFLTRVIRISHTDSVIKHLVGILERVLGMLRFHFICINHCFL